MDTESILFCFKKYKDRFVYLTRYPLSNSDLTEQVLFSNEKFIINKVYSFDLFVGYSFDFFNKDITYAPNFLNYVEQNVIQNLEVPCNLILKTDDFIVLAKNSYTNILIIGNSKYDSDF